MHGCLQISIALSEERTTTPITSSISEPWEPVPMVACILLPILPWYFQRRRRRKNPFLAPLVIISCFSPIVLRHQPITCLHMSGGISGDMGVQYSEREEKKEDLLGFLAIDAIARIEQSVVIY